MADQINFTPLRALDRNGLPVAAAEALFYISGTSTLQTVYSDSAGTTPHAQPLVADARGVFPQVFSNVTLKVTVTDPLGAVLPGFPLDPVPKTAIGGTGAANITFAPTADIPSSDTQSAIERVQANILTTAQDLGLGVIADAPVIANLDSASTASGQYRISSTTTGTFPAGLSAASGGIVQMSRETSASATQVILHGGSERRSTRDLVAGVWGVWREDLTANQTLVAGDIVYHNGTNMARLPKGTARQTLSMDASGALPEWGNAYGCRAFVNFDGVGGATIRRSGGVSSVSRSADGDYTILFSPALLTADYVVLLSTVGPTVGADTTRHVVIAGDSATGPLQKTTTALRILHGSTNGSFLFDSKEINVAVFY